MARKSAKAVHDLPMLGRKFAIIFTNNVVVKNRKELADAIGYANGTLGEWVNGRTDRGGVDGRVPEAALEALSRILVKIFPHVGDVRAARRLWLGSERAFERVIDPDSDVELLAVLARHEQRLPLKFVPFDSERLEMVPDCIDVPEDAEYIDAHEKIAFLVEARIGSKLTVLYEDIRGWSVLSPGNLHGGLVKTSPERIPAGDKWIPFAQPLGPHRFVFIEHPATLVADLPAAGAISALDSEIVRGFARQLETEAWVRKWRWNAMYLFVEESDAASDAG
ncbi:MAG: hypothetical protein KDJ37_00245 [Hyphomicrobiaceae bacterium]|nr:hypothetical protein [Hyphomicrobiaceae bacterium]